MQRLMKAARGAPTAPLELKFVPLKSADAWCSMCFRTQVTTGVVVRCPSRGTFNVVCTACVACMAVVANEAQL